MELRKKKRMEELFNKHKKSNKRRGFYPVKNN